MSSPTAGLQTIHAGVAQLVRALPCHGRGRGFESRLSRHSTSWFGVLTGRSNERVAPISNRQDFIDPACFDRRSFQFGTSGKARPAASLARLPYGVRCDLLAAGKPGCLHVAVWCWSTATSRLSATLAPLFSSVRKTFPPNASFLPFVMMIRDTGHSKSPRNNSGDRTMIFDMMAGAPKVFITSGRPAVVSPDIKTVLF
jgi:hypothetical protein